MLTTFVRKIIWIIVGLWLCGLFAIARADTYQMNDGTSVSGDIISFNDDGIIFHTPDDKYTDRIPWTQFSQDALKALDKNPKLAPFAEPFIETPPPSPGQKQVSVHDVTRLDLPPQGSVIGGLFSSSLGIIFILLIYAANIFAGYEIAIFRSRPIGLVAGVSAVLPIVGPIIFLSMPTVLPPGATEEDMQMPTGAPPEAAALTDPLAQTAQPAPAEGGVHLAATVSTPSAIPETQVFQRGQYTFNRRFIETKFSGFFGMVRSASNRDMVLVVKTPRAQYVAWRVTRISANEAHFEVEAGAGRQEIMVPLGEIVEIQLKHKDA